MQDPFLSQGEGQDDRNRALVAFIALGTRPTDSSYIETVYPSEVLAMINRVNTDYTNIPEAEVEAVVRPSSPPQTSTSEPNYFGNVLSKLQALSSILDAKSPHAGPPDTLNLRAIAVALEDAVQDALRFCPCSARKSPEVKAIFALLFSLSSELLLQLERNSVHRIILFDQRLVTIQSEWAVIYDYMYRKDPFGDSMTNTFTALQRLARYLDTITNIDPEIVENGQQFNAIVNMVKNLDTEETRLKGFLATVECNVPERMIALGNVMRDRAVILISTM